MATDHRPVVSESVCVQRDLQDGNEYVYPSGRLSGTLGCITGPFGCLLPCSYTPTIPPPPALLPWFGGFSVQGPTFGLSTAPGIQQIDGDSRRSPSDRRVRSPSVLRRLASPTDVPVVASGGSVPLLDNRVTAGSHLESAQVRPCSLSGFYLRGVELPNSTEHGQGQPLSGFRRPAPSVCLPQEGSSVRSFPPVSPGGPELRSGVCAVGSPSSSATSTVPPCPLASLPGSSLGPYSSSPSIPPGSQLVVERGSPFGRGPGSSSGTLSLSDHGCQQERVGGTCGAIGSVGVRSLDATRISAPHQQPGTDGSSQSSRCLSIRAQGPLRVGIHRQHDSRLLHSETRGDPLPVIVSGGTPPSSTVPVSEHHPPGQTPSGTTQCVSRQPVSCSSGSAGRVVSSSGSGQYDLPVPRFPDGRLVCHSVQPSSTSVCLTSQGPSRMGCGCPVSVVGSSLCICLPSVYTASRSPSEGQVIQVPSSSGGSSVAPEVVVQRSPGPLVRSPQESSTQERPSLSARERSSRRPRPLQASRLAVIRDGLRKRKFSPQVASLIAKARRSSTSTVYNAKWKIFSNWCCQREIDPVHPSIQQIADFLAFLFEVQKLAVSTIKGYRSMLSNTLGFRGLSSIGSNPFLGELIRSFELSRPVSRSLTPRWDLSCVLWSLTRAPFEPLDKATTSHLTWKTVFLLTFASAKRRSEIHALAVDGVTCASILIAQ